MRLLLVNQGLKILLLSTEAFHGFIVVSLPCTDIFSWHLFSSFIASSSIFKQDFLKFLKTRSGLRVMNEYPYFCNLRLQHILTSKKPIICCFAYLLYLKVKKKAISFDLSNRFIYFCHPKKNKSWQEYVR